MGVVPVAVGGRKRWLAICLRGNLIAAVTAAAAMATVVGTPMLAVMQGLAMTRPQDWLEVELVGLALQAWGGGHLPSSPPPPHLHQLFHHPHPPPPLQLQPQSWSRMGLTSPNLITLAPCHLPPHSLTQSPSIIVESVAKLSLTSPAFAGICVCMSRLQQALAIMLTLPETQLTSNNPLTQPSPTPPRT